MIQNPKTGEWLPHQAHLTAPDRAIEGRLSEPPIHTAPDEIRWSDEIEARRRKRR